MSDYFVLMLIVLVIIGTISAWWLFALFGWGRIWLLAIDFGEISSMNKRIKIAEYTMMKEHEVIYNKFKAVAKNEQELQAMCVKHYESIKNKKA